MSEQPRYLDPGEPRFCAKCGQPTQRRTSGGRARPHCPACGWTYYAKNALGAAIAIQSDDGQQILLVQRAHEPYAGWWMLPAGFVEYGDSATDTAVREAEEETGLRVELTGLRGLYYGADDPRDVAHLAVYDARIVSGEPRPGDDACAVRFFSATALPTQIAFEAQRQAIADWTRAARQRGSGGALPQSERAGERESGRS
jgi:ADP-ribose pyrophosphatase YjhB (NUDIX family)